MGIGASIVLTSVAIMDVAGMDCMQDKTSEARLVELPQPRTEVVLYHREAAASDGRGVIPAAVPDMGMAAEMMGSWAKAKVWSEVAVSIGLITFDVGAKLEKVSLEICFVTKS